MKKQKVKIQINRRPFAVPIEMRPLWRISLIVTVIAVVSGKEQYLSMNKVSILVWMLIRKTRWTDYEDFLLNRSPKIPLVSVDTATYKAIEFSRAKNFVTLKEKRLYLTETGQMFYDLLVDLEIMTDERNFLSSFGKKLTDNKIKALTAGVS